MLLSIYSEKCQPSSENNAGTDENINLAAAATTNIVIFAITSIITAIATTAAFNTTTTIITTCITITKNIPATVTTITANDTRILLNQWIINAYLFMWNKPNGSHRQKHILKLFISSFHMWFSILEKTHRKSPPNLYKNRLLLTPCMEQKCTAKVCFEVLKPRFHCMITVVMMNSVSLDRKHQSNPRMTE